MRRLRLPQVRWPVVGAGLQRIDARVPWTYAVIVVILLAGLVPIGLSVTGVLPVGTDPPSVAASQSPSPSAESPSPGAEATGAVTPPPAPSPTPEGTPAPHPSEPIDQAASASITPPSPGATPTATPQPGLWRLEGYVVDENENPLANVCVVVGPRGCHRFSQRTDERGHYFLDVAQPIQGVNTTFDFYFEMPGRQTVWWQITPGGPIEFNVVLRKS